MVKLARLIVPVLLMLILFSCASEIRRDAGVSEEQMREIIPVMQKETSRRISILTRLPDGSIEAQIVGGGRYRLRKVRGHWKVLEHYIAIY